MALIDSWQCLGFAQIRTDTAATDAGSIDIPSRGLGNVLKFVAVYNALGGSSATATLGVFGGAGGTGAVIVADAALTTHTGQTVVSERTVAATGVTPAVTADRLYFRVGTASGVPGSSVCVAVYGYNLPGV
jgi:hypothetical protein